MRAYHVEDGLTQRDHRMPEPGPGEVTVAVHAVSLSNRELLILQGRYVLAVKPGVIPVSDGAGVVIAAGPGVTGVRAGDRVMATLFPWWRDGPLRAEYLPQVGGSLDGMLTEVAVLPARALVPVPGHLSFAEAATLPCAGVTAWNALSGIRPGDVVVTLGTGGVALFAVQWATALGAVVVATTGRAERVRRLRELGADHVIDYRAVPDWAAAVREVTGGRGADRVVDTAGDLGASLRALAVGGEVAFVGSSAGPSPALDPRLLFRAAATARTVAAGSHAHFTAMNTLISEHRLRPVIDRTFPFAQAPAAYRYYEHTRPFGKVVIEIRGT